MSLHEAMLYTRQDDGKVKCNLCARRCLINAGTSGFCSVRENKNGTLYSLNYSKTVSVGIDPISKKPLYHFNPGALVLSIAIAGCNFHCQFCDNWTISQEPKAPSSLFSPKEAIKAAQNAGCQGLSYTYTEPTIFMEYVYDTAKLAKQAGLFNTFVTNGYMTPEAVQIIAPYLDAVTVDFKGSADPDFYRTFMDVPNVNPIYETLKEFKLHNIHIELTNLVIPKTGDSSERIQTLAKWIKDYLGPNTPLHMLRFYPEYKMINTPATSVQEMEHAYLTAKNQDLNFVYIGNITDHPAENTICPNCDTPVIKRYGFEVTQWNLTQAMCCSVCGYSIPIKGKLWQNNQRFPYALF
ncbi:MAG: AmmeMemoRadiSam system radical SAM enzyme [Nitrososphaerota archaeon]|jgi:pyruvate formate lyase activating enzyme|nr:AmmeMemoRadiSam system radical SAM enzyme [Nitrososphaerota archaeon]